MKQGKLKLKKAPRLYLKKRLGAFFKKSYRFATKKPVSLTIGKNKDSFFNKHRSPIPKYFKESVAELKKVTWPDRRKTLSLTLAVVVFVSVFTLIIAAADFGLNKAAERIFLK